MIQKFEFECIQPTSTRIKDRTRFRTDLFLMDASFTLSGPL